MNEGRNITSERGKYASSPSQRLSRRIKKIRTSIADLFCRKRAQSKSRGRAISDLRREGIQRLREGTYWSVDQPAQLPPAQPARLSVPEELRGPVDRKPVPPPREHRLRRRPAFKRGREGIYLVRGTPYEQWPPTAGKAPSRQRPLPHPPTSQAPQRCQGSERRLNSSSAYSHMPRNAPEAGSPTCGVPRTRHLNATLPPPEHKTSSPLFPKPLNVRRSASGQLVRHGVTPGSITQKRFEPVDREPPNGNCSTQGAYDSFGRGVSRNRHQPLNPDTVPVATERAPETGYTARARLRSLTIDLGYPQEGVHPALREPTPKSKKNPAHRDQYVSEDRSSTQTSLTTQRSSNSLRAMPRHSSERKPSAPRNTTNRPSSLPPRHSESPRIRLDAPMQPPTVHAVVTWISDNLAHIPYAITSLSALAMWGFTRYLPTHISILCPEHCRNVVTGWAIATGVVVYPQQKGFGLQLWGEEGQVRLVRVKFVGAEVFARFRTVGTARVLSLASLVDVLAGEFMDMNGENAGEKRVVLGGGISWAVERMTEVRAEVGEGEVRNVGNPLFMEPFVCTFPGSRELFVKAGLIQAKGAREQRSRGLKKDGSRAADKMRHAPSKRVPWAVSAQ